MVKRNVIARCIGADGGCAYGGEGGDGGGGLGGGWMMERRP